MLTAGLLCVVAASTVACRASSGKVADRPSTGPATTAAITTTVPTSTTVATGPSVPAAASATTVNGSMRTPDGRTRSYHLYAPTGVGRIGSAGAAVPLLVALHGGTGWGTQFERTSRYDGLAEAHRFIVVYPDGVGVGVHGTDLRTWNGGGCCGAAAKQHVDDVTFIRLLIARIRSQYATDPARIFATGHSNGGILALRLACELSDKIAAIGVQSAALEVDPCRPTHPVSVLQIHGVADGNIPIGGGSGPNTISGVAFNRPIDGARMLAAADRCSARPTLRTDTTNTDLMTTSWSPCAGGAVVTFFAVASASHAWMGQVGGGSGRVGTPYAKLDSSLTIWDFLSQHPRRA